MLRGEEYVSVACWSPVRGRCAVGPRCGKGRKTASWSVPLGGKIIKNSSGTNNFLRFTSLFPFFVVPLHRKVSNDPIRRDGRVVDYTGLENRRAERHRGFESLSLRNIT